MFYFKMNNFLFEILRKFLPRKRDIKLNLFRENYLLAPWLISRGINISESACQSFPQGFNFANIAKKLEKPPVQLSNLYRSNFP